ncbi:MAG: fused MFS/spermidine synthase [Caldilineales bacterium]|nr:fused MFS/spermidine synthase [Caldilineales bacterium]
MAELESAQIERPDLLWRPNLIVFISNACIMIIELVAGRMVAPYIGVSLYTWTGVIGVILAGISLGNYIGGKLADSRASRQLLGALFIASGLATFSILFTVNLVGDWGTPPSWPLIVSVLFFVAAVFLLPSVILGCISPIVVKLTLRDLHNTGDVVGKIYASSAAGSIAGTFLTGFFLISWFGTSTILLVVGAVLIILGILLGQWRKGWRWQIIAIVLVVIFVVVPPVQALRQGPCWRETNYFCIKVYDKEQDDGSLVRVLALDRLVHSYTSLDDPTKLVYGYEQMYAEASEYLMQRISRPKALFIGGGGYTFPKYLEAVYPQTVIDVVEIDPAVTQTAYSVLGLQPDTSIRSINEDARQFFINLNPDVHYDLVLGDAFNDYSVPYHLTTHEFNQLVRAHLSDEGVYLVNLIDGTEHRFLAAYVRTLRQTFPHVYVAPTGEGWRDVSRTTYVVMASPSPLDLEELRALRGNNQSHELDRWLLEPSELEEILVAVPPIQLTDDYVPVDNLLATVFNESAATR